MPARHVAARHRAPRSVRRSAERLVSDVRGLLPSSVAARAAVGLAAGATGVAVGVAGLGLGQAPASSSTRPAEASPQYTQSEEARSLLADHVAAQSLDVSRSQVRPPLLSVQRATKSAALPVRRQDVGGAVTTTVPPPSPQQIAASLLASYGWDSSQFSCLDALWIRESNWSPYAENSSSGAYGIPQALPSSKMAMFGNDWSTNAETQIKWGLWYIRQSYGSPCGAWYFWESHNWY